MAQKVQVLLVDDIDGGAADETVLDGPGPGTDNGRSPRRAFSATFWPSPDREARL